VNSNPIRSTLLLAAISFCLTGCIRDVVGPGPAPEAGTGASRASGPGADPISSIRLPDPPAPVEGGPGANTSMTLAVGEAGTIQAGRFTLFLHKNALKKDATVTMWVTDPSAMQVEITVTPADANDFQVPARVTADLSDQPSVDVSTQTMFYWDGGWDIPNDVTVDPTAHTVMATMHQLSNCRVGAQPQAQNHATN